MKKIYLFILSLLCLFALAACSGYGKVENNKSISLVDEDITVYVGETYQFNPSGAESFSYSSSDENIVKVSKDGTLVGMSDGTAFVVVSTDTDSVTCRVDVLKTENYIRLSYENISAVCGSKISLKAEVVKNGSVSVDGVDFVYTESDMFSAEKTGNELSVTLNDVGSFSIKVTSGSLESICKIKSVNTTANVLGEPSLSVENCATVKWEAVAGADSYMYSINGGEWQSTKETSFDATEVTDEMKYADNAVFAVKAVSGDEDFDHIDGKFATIDFSHKYKETSIEEHTCVKSGVSDFECEICHKKYTDDARLDEHDYVDGACKVCGAQLTKKIIYRYDEYNDCYYVAGADAGFDYENVYILAKYDDGTHGEKDVKYIGYKAFASNTAIKKVVLPESMTEFEDKNPNFVRERYDEVKKETIIESLNTIDKDGKKVSSPLRGCCFDGCTNLEYVSMRGITTLPAMDEDQYSHWNFRDCYNLKQVIVGDGFSNKGAAFMRWDKTEDDAENQTDIYATGTVTSLCDSTDYPIASNGKYGNNMLLTGDVFYYKDDTSSPSCFEWCYAEDGETIVSGGKHEFLASGKCKKCGSLNNNGIAYGYDSKTQTYYVSDNKSVSMSEIVILDEYNDGTHGTHPVTFVKNGAFTGNQTLVKITLPESITRLDGSVFMNCPKLEYVSMIGIKDMPYMEISNPAVYGSSIVTTNNNFLDCYNLKTLFVNKDFNLGTNQQFLGRGDNVTPKIDIYSNGTVENSNINANPNGQNNLFTGNIYYYDNTGMLDTCLRWTVIDGVTAKSSHNFVDDRCSVCGAYDGNGLIYAYDSTNKCYFVTCYIGSETEITIPDEFNDGTNGVKAVASIGEGCYWGTDVTKIILPACITDFKGNSFQSATNLEYISMTGVTHISTVNNFINNQKITTVIVNKAFTLDNQQFKKHGITADPTVVIYVDGTKAESTFAYVNKPGDGIGNEFLTGEVYYLGDGVACQTWKFDDNGEIVKTSHNYANDKCTRCGEYNTHGVKYGFDSTTKTYYVASYSGTESTVNILSSYNDGTNGEYAVTYIGASAFIANNVITKVILPSSVTAIKDNAFLGCSQLEYIEMKGVAVLGYGNSFLNCVALKTVIVGKTFNLNGQAFKTQGTETAHVNLYVDGSESESTITAETSDMNNMFTGIKYYYSETAPTDTTGNYWHYVDGVATIWETTEAAE